MVRYKYTICYLFYNCPRVLFLFSYLVLDWIGLFKYYILSPVLARWLYLFVFVVVIFLVVVITVLVVALGLVSTVQRSEAAFPVLYSRFSLVIYFIHISHISVYMSIPISQFIPPPLSPLGVHMFVLYICVSISALQTGSSVPFF